jgi:hypothetical protein
LASLPVPLLLRTSKPGYAVAGGGFMTVQIEVREETVIRLKSVAQSLSLSLDEYLAKVAELVYVPQSNGEEINPKETPPPNETMLAILARSAERMKDRPISGSTEETLKLIREGRAGRMFGYEPTE